MKRLFDIIFSFIGIIILLPFFFVFALLIIADSGFPVFYYQKRVGKNGIDFLLMKFRTMKKDADKQGLLTVGEKDSRITNIGFFLRNYKLDELPQLFNVLLGDMSLVGPRPEVRKYVEMYTEEQKKVLTIKPGITDYASIEYSNENEIIARSENPEELYIEEIMPAKLKLNLKYISEQNFAADLKIILKTIAKIFN
ncbi:MAG: sugar transferase [Bacteroidetes bacterium]|nr:sugar transferase [Bacteroidota bacterium]